MRSMTEIVSADGMSDGRPRIDGRRMCVVRTPVWFHGGRTAPETLASGSRTRRSWRFAGDANVS